MFKRTRTTAILLALFMALTTPAAHASDPHFGHTDASGPDDNGSLTISFTMVNLSIGARITVTASSLAKATYACQNRGGNFPSDPKKKEEVEWVATSGKFTANLFGRIRGKLVLDPPHSTLKCPPGQKKVLMSISHEDAHVSAIGVTAWIDGIFSVVLNPI